MEARERQRKGPQTVGKIRKALDFMRNQQLEVPFIAFYRKEYVQPELNINDLWKVYRYDAKVVFSLHLTFIITKKLCFIVVSVEIKERKFVSPLRKNAQLPTGSANERSRCTNS